MTDIFDDNAPADQQQVVPQPPAAIQLPDEVAELVGEGKKYATPEAALKALPHAQKHIATLEAELAELREKASGAHNVDELYETVQDLLKKQKATPGATEVSEDVIANVLARQLEQREAKQKQEQNVAAFKDALGKKFGDKAKEQFAAKAAELGLSVEALSDVVRKSAPAGLALFGLTASPGAPKPVHGSVDTTRLHSQQPPEPQVKPVMFGAKSADVMAAWNEAKRRAESKNQ